jgi:class 3 adenylate cyclase/predicted ATPase
VAVAAEVRPSEPAVTSAAAALGASSPISERRLVTVLFADLVGFTPFAEERDPEDVRNTLEHFGELARATVGRYGGTIEKFIGDAVMAVWGTPLAHEDDAERAVRAALELVDSMGTLGPGIEARAGVLTGEAAINLGATDQGLLAGDLVNTCARLQAVAPAGSVLVGEPTMRAASAAVAFEAVGEQSLKGKSAPTPAWRALRVIAQRGGAGRAEALETPFVGREEEFRLLREQLHLTGRDPRVRLVSITGPAGVGKSRLAWELEKYIDGVVEPIYWHRGRSPAYGEGISFWALGEMVRGRAGLAESDDESTTRLRIRATVAQYVADATEREWIEQALLALLGAGQPAQPQGETLFAAWRRFFESIAAQGTTVLVFEDLHWADEGTIDFIDHLLDWSKSVPLLVLALARPELFERRPGWGAGRRTFTAIALDPLPEPAMREMLAALVPDLPEAALSAITRRADGIPLYAVETVRMLLADGRLAEIDGSYRPTGALGELEVPDSLRSLITARLDALDAEDRRLLQDASVIGQSFTVTSLSAITDLAAGEGVEQRLRSLVRRELLTMQADPRSPERGQYGFMQSLIREVAYSTLARPERRARHLAAARHFEALGSEEIAGVLAGHYVAAHAASPAGPEADALAGQARIALRSAADRASALRGHAQAAAFLEQALATTREATERAPLLERQAEAADMAGRYEQAEKAIRAAIDHYREMGDPAGVARSRGVLGRVLINEGRVQEAVHELERALEELPDDAEAIVQGDVMSKLARAYYRNLEKDKSIEMANRALAVAEHHRLPRLAADAMVSKGTALSMISRTLESMVLLRGGLELARREGDLATVLRAGNNLSPLVGAEEGAAQATALVRQMIEVARATGDVGSTIWQMGGVLIGSVFAGEPLESVLAEAEELLAGDLEAIDRTMLRFRMIMPAAFAGRDVSSTIDELMSNREFLADPQVRQDLVWTRSLVAVARGDYPTAVELSAGLAETHPQLGTIHMASLLSAVAGDVEAARRHYQRALELPVLGRIDEASRIGARASILAMEGRHVEAVPAYREALRAMRELGDVLGIGLVAMSMLKYLGRDNPEARAVGEEALAKFERMGSPRLVEQVHAALGYSEGGDTPTEVVGASATATGGAGLAG